MALLPSDARIGEVSLAVSSLDRSLAFYTEVLGFRLHNQSGTAAALGANPTDVLLRLEQIPGAIPQAPPIERALSLCRFWCRTAPRSAGRSVAWRNGSGRSPARPITW